jgi:hypothetical protein
MCCNVETYDLKELYLEGYHGNRNAMMKINDILQFRADYGNFESVSDCIKANEMLNKLRSAIDSVDVSNAFKRNCVDSIDRSGAILDQAFKFCMAKNSMEGVVA